MIEKAYILETKIPIVFSRYTPGKVESKNNVYLIIGKEKNGSRIFLTPGVIAFVMFMRKRIEEKHLNEATSFFLNYFLEQIKESYADRNDVLIDGKKIMGLTIMPNVNGSTMIRFVLTLRAETIRNMTSAEDFEDRKYKGITGVCDETGMNDDAIRSLVNGFVEAALSWRPKNDSD
jgi:hypothetical protein